MKRDRKELLETMGAYSRFVLELEGEVRDGIGGAHLDLGKAQTHLDAAVLAYTELLERKDQE